jgi:hypothetical protein
MSLQEELNAVHDGFAAKMPDVAAQFDEDTDEQRTELSCADSEAGCANSHVEAHASTLLTSADSPASNLAELGHIKAYEITPNRCGRPVRQSFPRM